MTKSQEKTYLRRIVMMPGMMMLQEVPVIRLRPNTQMLNQSVSDEELLATTALV